MHGTVTTFDEARGLGVVTADDGTEHPFHCVEILDGTRTITPGAVVTFDVVPRLGRHEAARIAPA